MRANNFPHGFGRGTKAATFTLSGPTTGTTGVASTFTVTPDGFVDDSIVVTITATGATLSASTLTFAHTASAQTFTATSATEQTISVSIASSLAESGSPISWSVIAVDLSTTSSVFFGDSIVAGSEAGGYANRWVTLVADALYAGAPSNEGIGGTVLQNSNGSGAVPLTDNGRDRYTTAILGAGKRDSVFIAYGFNDARYTAAPATFNVTAYANDLTEVLAGCLAGGYTAGQVVVVSPYWITDTGLTVGGDFSGQTRGGFEAFVTAAQSAAAAAGVRYVDVYAEMRDVGGASLIYFDNIHPTADGHAVIANAVLRAVVPSKACSVSASSASAGNLAFSITAPVAAVVNYTIERALQGTVSYSGTLTQTGLTGSFTGLAAGTYQVRARANYSGSSGAWAYSSATVVA